jgi:hypothetical protein
VFLPCKNCALPQHRAPSRMVTTGTATHSIPQNVEVRQRRQRPSARHLPAPQRNSLTHSHARTQLDEDELNQLREYVKERKQLYRQQAGMYERASANLGTRGITAAKPKALNKREKRKLRAFGGKMPGNRAQTPSRQNGTLSRPATASNGNRVKDEDFGDRKLGAPLEPQSLITQTAFRTMEMQV